MEPFRLLTPREVEVAHLVAQGISNAGIAERLGTKIGTVKSQLQDIYWKLEIRVEPKRVRLTRWVLLGGIER